MTPPIEPVWSMDERWPGYAEQSWSERFAELDRRYEQFQTNIDRIAATASRTTPAPSQHSELADGLTDAQRRCLYLVASGPLGRIASDHIDLDQFEGDADEIGALEYGLDMGWIEEVCVDTDSYELRITDAGQRALRQPPSDAMAKALSHVVELFDEKPITERMFKPSVAQEIRAALTQGKPDA